MKLLTLARHLQQRKARERAGQFVAEGVRTLETLLVSGVRVVGILAAPTLGENNRGRAILARAAQDNIEVLTVTEAEFASAADTDTPQGVLAIAEVPQFQLGIPPQRARYLLLDGLQDPGNVGTIVRSAAAFGFTATISLPGTVDLWNAKVVRSAMGSHFTHPAVPLPFVEASAFLAAHGISCWAADTEGTALSDATGDVPDRLALVVSNEGAGLSEAAAGLTTRRVAIPMAAGVESLNVAVAAGILLHAFRALPNDGRLDTIEGITIRSPGAH